jgi:hypothetical protein
MFGETVEEWDPSPYSFRLDWVDQDNTKRSHEMDDWETLGAYFCFESEHGEEEALKIFREKYDKERFNNGLVLGFSTHKRRNATRGTENQCLLVGLRALPENNQPDMFLGWSPNSPRPLPFPLKMSHKPPLEVGPSDLDPAGRHPGCGQ